LAGGGAGSAVRFRDGLVRSRTVGPDAYLDSALGLRSMGRLSFALAIVAATVSLARGGADPLPRAGPEAVGLSTPTLQAATGLLETAVAERRIAGAVAGVARRGRLAYLEAVGQRDIAGRAPMTEDSLFRIYSMTKPVTAVAVMMLFEEGRFALGDPVSKYLPEFRDVVVAETSGGVRPPIRAITIEDLLLHTSGLSHRTSALYQGAQVRSRRDTLPQFVRKIVRTPLMEDPGTRYRYSESPTVLGRLVEVWAGRAFDEFLVERVFKPLRMSDTGFWVEPGRRPRLTTVYALEGRGLLRPFEIEELPFTERPALLEGAVGLVSTVPDFMRFSQMLLARGTLDGARLLRPDTVDLMVRNGLSEPVLQSRGGAIGWGLGNVDVVMDPTALNYPASVGEYGWDGSAGTIFWVDPKLELVTVLMWQSAPANPDSLRQRFKTLVRQAVLR
jgi:CubicO group peptidase (beta-lactamase class C family)